MGRDSERFIAEQENEDNENVYKNCIVCGKEFWDGSVGCRFGDTTCDTCKEPKNKKKIYFAGKISKNDWRNELTTISIKPSWNNVGRWDYWGIWGKYNYKQYLEQEDFIYTGPFFISCDHGCSHGENTHGAGESSCIDKAPKKAEIFEGCINQIKDSDYVFCWIDEMDCYGTLFELGVAHNQGKNIFIGINAKLKSEKDDLWFVKNCAESNYYNDVSIAWKEFLDKNISKISNEEKENFVITLDKEELEDFKEMEKRQPLSKTIVYFKRNKEIVRDLKKLYNNKCQICDFTFKKDNGENYSETHHVIPLGQNGSDDIKNLIVVCPNCHRQLHYAKNKKYDITYKEEHYKLTKEMNDGNKS